MKIIVGLPSRNESKSIRNVVCQIDQTLQGAKLSSNLDIIIVNADCESDDHTSVLFSTTETFLPKISLSCSLGKGNAILRIMKFAVEEENADGIILIDTDIPQVPKAWLEAFLQLAHEGFDLVLPRRKPLWNAGDLTYQICFPVLTALWGVDMRNPIAGEVFISRRLIKKCLEVEWHRHSLGYGVDFLISNIGSSLKWGEVYLSTTKGNPLRSFHLDSDGNIRMGRKFYDVLESVIYFSRSRLCQPPPKSIHYSTIDYVSWDADQVHVNSELESLALNVQRSFNSIANYRTFLGDDLTDHLLKFRCVGKSFKGISLEVWYECLSWTIRFYDPIKLSDCNKKLLETLFLSRVVGHYFEIIGTSQWYDGIISSANLLFEKRLILFDWYSDANDTDL